MSRRKDLETPSMGEMDRAYALEERQAWLREALGLAIAQAENNPKASDPGLRAVQMIGYLAAFAGMRERDAKVILGRLLGDIKGVPS